MLSEKISRAIGRIQQAHEIASHMGNCLVLAYSGGKDSDVLLDLALKSGVTVSVQHNHTTADAPETVYHIRDVFKLLDEKGIPAKINPPPVITTADGKKATASMWNLIPKMGIPPTRVMRYCCEFLKERKFEGQHILTGIRWAESNNRANRGLHEKLHRVPKKRIVYMDENEDVQKLTAICQLRNRIATNPIIDWSNKEVWEYIRLNDIQMNPLYSNGYERIGCIGCPMSVNTPLELSRYPRYKAAYIRAFQKMIDVREQKGKENRGAFRDGVTVYRWWTEKRFNIDQLSLEDVYENL